MGGILLSVYAKEVKFITWFERFGRQGLVESDGGGIFGDIIELLFQEFLGEEFYF